jgi:hypothetical protein
MNIFETINRMRFLHKQIQRETTGIPEDFARQIHLKKRQLYNILEELKMHGADIRYDPIRHTYYYANEFEVELKIGVKSSSN